MSIPKYIEYNNQIVRPDNTLDFEKDKLAVKSYFIDYVNQNTVFFHDLKEKLDYLIENEYYETEFLNNYTYEEIKTVFQLAYSYKFRFPSYMSAFKFYNDYALKTNDKAKILERYEDRISICALFMAKGNIDSAIRLTKAMIEQRLQPATPTFLNAGRKRRGELVSCFLMEVNDSLNDIAKAIDMSMQLSKLGGGVSLNLSKLRAKGESIKGIENTVKGVVGVMKLLDVAFRYADQMGQRQGSGAAYYNIFGADIDDFLDTRKINADDDTRVKTLSIGVIMPDKFVQLAKEDKDMYVFYPHSVFKEYGIHMDDMNMNEWYQKLVDNPRVRKKRKNPRKLWEKISILRFESGYPYLMFKDNANKEHALKEIGNIKMSNLCTEIFELSDVSTYTDYDQIDSIGFDISCNLASLNIEKVMDLKKIKESCHEGIDGLTFVSDETNIVNTPAIKKANESFHSVGLGALNLHGYLAKNKIAYESPQARDFANIFFMMMNYYTLERSMEIAKERGETFYRFEDSEYASGKYFDKYIEFDITPEYEKIALLFQEQHIPTKEDWQNLKADVMKHGLYHAYRLAIAPTGSISYIQSATAAVMPIMNRVEDRTYGNSKTYYPMPHLSAETWFFYKEAYDMDMFRIIDMISTIQQHVDQGISTTIFLKNTATTRDLTRIDAYAHYKGLKSLYYMRTKNVSMEECLSCSV